MSAFVGSLNTVLLRSLLPYDVSQRKHGDLRTGLKEYAFLTQALREASIAFENGELEKFDALVGENACQTRAVRVASIARNSDCLFTAFKDPVEDLQKKISKLLSSKELSEKMRKNLSLQELLDVPELAFYLTSDQLFLLQSYLLSETKEITSSFLFRKEIADPKKLKRFGDVSSSFANELVRKLRQQLAAASVDFVRNTACSLQNEFLTAMVSENFTINHNTCWPCTPMFWTYQSLLYFARHQGIPIVIHVQFKAKDMDNEVVNEDYLFFQADPADASYAQTIPTELNLEEAACVVQGIVYTASDMLPSKSQWRSTINEYSILDIIFAGAADHRQYPDPDQEYLIEKLKDPELERFKTLARSKGFSSDNPTTFFIQHVYAAKAGNIYLS